MATKKARMVEVAGTHRTAVTGARVAGKVDASEQAEIAVRVRSRVPEKELEKRLHELMTQPIAERKYLTREEFASEHGADPKDLAKVDTFAHEHGLTVVEADAAKRMVRLRGSLANLQAAFGVKLSRYKSKTVSYRGRTGSVYVPKELAGIVEGVYGLDDRPVAKPHYRQMAPAKAAARAVKKTAKKSTGKKGAKPKPKPKPKPKKAADVSFVVTDIVKLYNFPSKLDGSGQTVGLIELNTPTSSGASGSGYTNSDLNKFFAGLGMQTPSVVAVSVDGGSNLPGVNTDADGEVTLDIEVAGAAAPGAAIAVYFAPNTDKGFIDAVSAAVHDNVRKPSVISISWGGPEDFSTAQFRNGLNAVLRDAATLGVTVCCAAGDSGSSDLDPSNADGSPHADFPSSSQYALACGGTTLIGKSGVIASEVVWNEGRRYGSGGGGVSNVFPLPDWQKSASVPKSPKGVSGRGVPDVAGDADPMTGYRIVLAGSTAVIGGTSAVAPLWAGLIALLNQQLAAKGSAAAGFVNTLLYGLPAGSGAFHDITAGNNDIDGNLGKYSAGPGWDACTGLGSPNGAALVTALAP